MKTLLLHTVLFFILNSTVLATSPGLPGEYPPTQAALASCPCTNPHKLPFSLTANTSLNKPEGGSHPTLGYIPNEIIVKFREPVTKTLEKSISAGISATQLKLSGSLDKLNKKFHLSNIKPLFKDFNARRHRVKALLKKGKALLTKRERHILKRLNRAPTGAKVPDLDRIYKIRVEPSVGQSLEEVVAAYNKDPDVEYAELNYIISIDNIPDDPLYPIQWALNNTGQMYPESGNYNHPPGTPDCDIDAPEAWDVNTGRSEVIVAVVDTGVDYTHPDLDDNMWVNQEELEGEPNIDDDENGYVDDIYGYDFWNKNIAPYYDSDPRDDYGHGTHCAGIIAAEGNNGLAMTGVCWNARIISAKSFDFLGYGPLSRIVEAIEYAVDNGADVISNSWGGGGYMESMEEAINYAYSQGVIMVAAAGNDNSTDPHYPAYYDHVISVAATNSNDEKASFSTYGDWVDIAAPGVDILSLWANATAMGTPYGCYTTVMSGTSMACPHVSGACALLLSIYPEIDVDEVSQVLLQSTDPIPPEICISGRLNLYQAVKLLASGPQGIVFLDNDVYNCSDLIGIRLLDADLKGNGTQQVTIESNGGDFETVSLIESSPLLGVFTGTISTDSSDPNTEDGTLQVAHNQIITVTYEDNDDGTGSPAVATDTATADCQGPIVYNVQVEVPGPEPAVTFETNESSTAQILCGMNCEDHNNISATDSVMTTIHTIKLTGVLPETDYFFVIEATDANGNEITDDNDSQCYTFTTDTGPRDVCVPSQYGTIQEAIDISWDGGTVFVADGIYTGEGNTDIDFKGKAIIVKSENGPENCIIDCNGSENEPHRGFSFHYNEDVNSVLDGFTIKNGYGPTEQIFNLTRSVGGAVFCSDSSPTIKNCIITENSAALGAGIFCYQNSNPCVRNCIIIDNYASHGAGLYCRSSSPAIINCTISGNSADAKGGGIRCYDGSNPIIDNCILWDNQADSGEGPELALRSDCNVSVAYSDVEGGQWAVDLEGAVDPDHDLKVSWGAGNIDVDPCFVDPNNADYHLLPGSPCVDVGTNSPLGGLPAKDIEGQSRPIDGDNDGQALADMGAYESLPCEEPVIDLSAGQFKFEARQASSNPDTQILNIRNSGAETLNWVITYDCTWLNVDPCEGTCTGELDETTLSVDITALGGGSYNCQLTISDSNALNSPKTIEVNLHLYGEGQLPVPFEYPTIQAAIDAAADGNVVIVADGIYTGVGNRDIDFNQKAITVRSENGPNNCILNCDGTEAEPHRGFYFHNGEDENSIVDGFTITNGCAEYGGGIKCVGSTPTIENCIITGNRTRSDYPPIPERWSGGGLYGCDGPIINCTVSRNWSLYEGGGLHGCNGTISGCIISGNSASKGSGLYECDGAITSCTISGNLASSAGGLYECDGPISNCTISENLASSAGGLYRCDGKISNCTISGNFADIGGGLYRCIGEISNCTISGNTGIGRGGGLYLCGATNCTISGNSGRYGGGLSSPIGAVSNCTITGNTASYGGAISDQQSSTLISNCTISGNTASCDGGGIYSFIDCNPIIVNCILWGNTASCGNEIAVALYNDPWGGTVPSSITVRYSDVEGGSEAVYVDPECTLNWQTGNIDTDPLCLQQGYWDCNGIHEEPRDIWLEGDYHLWSYSPCINAGDPCGDYTGQTDIDGDQRVRYGFIDIGADEVYPVAGDFEPVDEAVDINDLGIFVNYWLNTCSETEWCHNCDIDQSGMVNFIDFAIFADNWLW